MEFIFLIVNNSIFNRLSDWALKALEPNSALRRIAYFFFKMTTGNKKLARLHSGFLIKEMFERFSKKINSALKPDRALWLYSAHDLTISSTLNTLGLFEVRKYFEISIEIAFTKHFTYLP